MSDAIVEALPQPRIDTSVSDAPTGVTRRRTEYSGVVWFGARPQFVAGKVVAVSGGHTRMQSGVFIPDSLPYVASRSADSVIAATIGLQSFNESVQPTILDHRATLAPDPRGGDLAWLHLQVFGVGLEPIALSYRIVVLVAPDAVAPSPTPIGATPG